MSWHEWPEHVGQAYSVLLVDTETKAEKWCHMGSLLWKPDKFWWYMGNFSCDCNRSITFDTGEEDDDGDEVGFCNTESNRYLAIRIKFENGTEYQIDESVQCDEPCCWQL